MNSAISYLKRAVASSEETLKASNEQAEEFEERAKRARAAAARATTQIRELEHAIDALLKPATDSPDGTDLNPTRECEPETWDVRGGSGKIIARFVECCDKRNPCFTD